jgi:hypothetical protein
MAGPALPLRPEPLLRTLGDHGVEFVIIGGFALAAHGVIRATKDVDVVPEPSPANIRRLAAALRTLEAEVLLADDFEPAELGIEPDEEGLSLGGNWVLRTTFGRLDVMQEVAGTRGYPSLREAAVGRDVPGAGRFWFAGLDDLIAMKVAAGRPQDEIDVNSLERARGHV